MLQYHPLITQSKASLDLSRDLHGGSGGGFVIRLYLILEISGQRSKKFSRIFFQAKPNTANAPQGQSYKVMDIPDVWYLLVNSSQMQAACKQQYKYTIRDACAENINNA